MTDSRPSQEDISSSRKIAASTFLGQALGLAEKPDSIASDLVTVKESANASVYSVELDSSVGTAAFLVYVFLLGETDADDVSGQSLYDDGLHALQLAADRDTPGPRTVAHAMTDKFGFILATTPATWRALNGEPVPGNEATDDDLPVTPSAEEARTSGAEDLHRALREANDHARSWLTAIRRAGFDVADERLEFTEEETALALFVLDSANVQHLLSALNVLVTSAQAQATSVMEDSEPPA